MFYLDVDKKQHTFTLQKQSKTIIMEKQIPQTGKFSEKQKENIRELIKMAGGAKFIAAECGVSVDNFHNPLRGLSSDFTTVDIMVKKAKAIVAKKVKQLA